MFEEAVASARAASSEEEARAVAREAQDAPVDLVGAEDDDLNISISAAASGSGASAGAVQPSRTKRKDGEG